MLNLSILFLYSQDLSNYKTLLMNPCVWSWFLYSQDLSNYKTDKAFYDGDGSFCTLKI